MADNTVFYSSWQPVRVNAGVGGSGYTVSGFFMNETGLQWTGNPAAAGSPNDEFGGWLGECLILGSRNEIGAKLTAVCDWWHGVPQLFYRISYYTTPAPASCADVYLKPVYI